MFHRPSDFYFHFILLDSSVYLFDHIVRDRLISQRSLVWCLYKRFVAHISSHMNDISLIHLSYIPNHHFGKRGNFIYFSSTFLMLLLLRVWRCYKRYNFHNIMYGNLICGRFRCWIVVGVLCRRNIKTKIFIMKWIHVVPSPADIQRIKHMFVLLKYLIWTLIHKRLYYSFSRQSLGKCCLLFYLSRVRYLSKKGNRARCDVRLSVSGQKS